MIPRGRGGVKRGRKREWPIVGEFSRMARMKKSLIESNPYLRDPVQRERMLVRNAYGSSLFEGAKLAKPKSQPTASKPHSKASTKKA